MLKFIQWLVEILAFLVFILLWVSAAVGLLYLRDRWREFRGRGAFYAGRAGVFVGREPLDAQQFHERFFRQRGVPAFVSVRVREILEEQVDGDLMRLRPTDELSVLVDVEPTLDENLVWRLEEEFYIKISDEEAEAARTVADLVNLVWSKVGAGRGDAGPPPPAAE